MDSKKDVEDFKKAAPKLPLSKVKRIAKTDPLHIITSQSAVAAVAFATELFVQVLTEEALAISQLEKPSGSRLTLRYDHLAAVVASSDRFAFLSDVIPETQNLVALTRENRVRYTALAPGQSVLPFRAQDTATAAENDGDAPEGEADPDAEPEPESDADGGFAEDFNLEDGDQDAEMRSENEMPLREEEVEPEPEPEPEPEFETELDPEDPEEPENTEDPVNAN
ncbi:LAME_0F18712g1_1 [Lachancea meyersii CBS 8951]|uniref:LAME_0F18712g1_1 n=1 Tax=Lachancea meyersii CBS 8951 TaxID=1266667 RepID=A0A1G4K0U4_9SACH|nr:LAME_0F18712g1_1 [Lachancea meyersii CBS 8951]